jgi:hypothetical protein
MVLVWMADEDSSRATPIKRRRQQPGGALGRVERSPGIKDNAVTVRMRDLDAAPADLLCSAMDSEAKAHAGSLSFLASPTASTAEMAG